MQDVYSISFYLLFVVWCLKDFFVGQLIEYPNAELKLGRKQIHAGKLD